MEWLLCLCEEYLLSWECLLRARSLLDRFLAATRNFPIAFFQHLGTACLLVSAKLEDDITKFSAHGEERRIMEKLARKYEGDVHEVRFFVPSSPTEGDEIFNWPYLLLWTFSCVKWKNNFSVSWGPILPCLLNYNLWILL